MKEKQDEINLKDIIGYCLNRWYVFIVTGLVMAGIAWSVGSKSVETQETQETQEAQNLYEKAVEYRENSILMNMDPLHVKVNLLSYGIILNEIVDGGNVSEYGYIAALVCQYESFVESGILAQRVASVLSMDEKFVDEILSVENNGISFIIEVKAEDDSSAKRISDEVENQIKKYKEELKNSGCEYELLLLSNVNKEIAEIELSLWQKDIDDYILTLGKNVPAKDNYENIKKIILFVFCDLILVFVILLTIYLYGGKIRSSLYIKSQYDLQELGSYLINGKGTCFFKRWRYNDVVALDINACAKMLEIKSGIDGCKKRIFFTSAIEDKEIEAVLALVIEQLKEKEIYGEYIAKIQEKPNELERIMGVQEREVVLIEKIGTSRIKPFEAEIYLYAKCNVEAKKIIFLY